MEKVEQRTLTQGQREFLANCPPWTRGISARQAAKLLSIKRMRRLPKRGKMFIVEDLVVTVLRQQGFYFVDVSHKGSNNRASLLNAPQGGR